MRKEAPLTKPVVRNSSRNEPKKTAKLCVWMPNSTAKLAASMTNSDSSVTREPQFILSASQPPRGRTLAPMKGPRKAAIEKETSGNSLATSRPSAAEKPMKEPKPQV